MLALLVAGASLAAEPPLRLDLPLACEVGETCFVQNHVDRDPGPGALDHACGPLTYDGHKGTDIRLPHLAAMRSGVAVVAAAPGIVRAVRDGMEDSGLGGWQEAAMAGRECGNGTLLDHGGGWETQYCHMRKGSVAVKQGERVAAGRRLGLVGLSGKSEFPHLHFAVRRHGEIVDPFVGARGAEGCGVAASPLWSPDAAAALAYRPSGLLGAGFADSEPSLDEIRAGGHRRARLAAGGRVLVFWSHIFGLRRGDVQVLRVIGPRGRVVVEKKGEPAPKNRATSLLYVGRRLESATWPQGVYRGQYRLLREGAAVIEEGRTVELR